MTSDQDEGPWGRGSPGNTKPSLESERRRLGFPTRRLPDQFAWPPAASPVRLGAVDREPMRDRYSASDRSKASDLPPESSLAAGPDHSSLSAVPHRCRFADSSKWRRGASGCIELSPDRRRGPHKNQSRSSGLALAELDWPSAVIGLWRTATAHERANSANWDIWG